MTDVRRGAVGGQLRELLPILPILLAESILWLGFGALLPVLTLYLSDQGIDTATLGWIVAAWPAARLVGEPLFGWLADRGDKRVLMLAGLIGTAIVIPMPLFVTGAPAFLVARALAGLATAAYDPAARAYILDATPPARRGAAFGFYSSAQMGGLLLGPAFGAVGAALGGGYAFPFLFCSVATFAAAALLAATVLRRPIPRAGLDAARSAGGSAAPAASGPSQPGDPARTDASPIDGSAPPAPPTRLWNRLLIAAIVVNIGSYFASGTYDVIWSLWMDRLGADLGLIGLTFVAFGLGVLVLSPIAGRWVDRRGPFVFVVVGSLGAAIAGVAYALLSDPVLVVPVVAFEGASFALLGPALFAVVALGTPAGRSATAQGIFGAAGTVGMIVASVTAGFLFAIDIHLPFYVFAITMIATLALGVAIGGRELRDAGGVAATVPAAATGASADAHAAKEPA